MPRWKDEDAARRAGDGGADGESGELVGMGEMPCARNQRSFCLEWPPACGPMRELQSGYRKASIATAKAPGDPVEIGRCWRSDGPKALGRRAGWDPHRPRVKLHPVTGDQGEPAARKSCDDHEGVAVGTQRFG